MRYRYFVFMTEESLSEAVVRPLGEYTLEDEKRSAAFSAGDAREAMRFLVKVSEGTAPEGEIREFTHIPFFDGETLVTYYADSFVGPRVIYIFEEVSE